MIVYQDILSQYLNKEQDKVNYRNESDRMHSLKQQINRTVNAIRGLRMHETDYKNVPEHLKPMADALLGMVAEHDTGSNKLAFSTDEAQKLAMAFAGLGSDSELLFDEEVYDTLVNLQEHMNALNEVEGRNTRSIRERNAHLEKIRKATEYIYAMIRETQKAFLDGKR